MMGKEWKRKRIMRSFIYWGKNAQTVVVLVLIFSVLFSVFFGCFSEKENMLYYGIFIHMFLSIYLLIA
nr:hypothetical protein [Acetatifactor sp.]